MTMTHEIPTGYLADILDQPAALEATRASLAQSFDLGSLPAGIRTGKFARIILTGMGSSHHVFYPFYYRLLQAGLPALLIETSELVHYASELIQPNHLMIAASQSGQSAEIMSLLTAAEQVGAPVLGLTNTIGSPLYRWSAAQVMTQAGAEYTVSCKSYTTALLALRWLEAAVLSADPSNALQALDAETHRGIAGVQAYLAAWQSHVDKIAQEIQGVRSLFLAGRGPSLAAALTGGLTTKESTHFQAEGMSSAALRHGPMEMIGPGAYVMVFSGEARTRHLNRNLAQDLARAGAAVAWVDAQDTSPAYTLPSASDVMRPIFEILPVQMMTLALARIQGRVAGQFDRAAKITTTE